MFTDKAPFVVTLIVAGLAWTLSHIIDQLLATPMLMYSTKVENSGGTKIFTLTLRNITRDKTFRDVRVLLTPAQNDTFTDHQVIPTQPASEGDDPGKREPQTFDFKFPEIQPNGQLDMKVSFHSSTAPSLRISDANGTIYPTTPSVETFLVENEFTLFAGLVVVWILALGGVYYFGPSTAGVGDD